MWFAIQVVVSSVVYLWLVILDIMSNSVLSFVVISFPCMARSAFMLSIAVLLFPSINGCFVTISINSVAAFLLTPCVLETLYIVKSRLLSSLRVPFSNCLFISIMLSFVRQSGFIANVIYY